MYGSGFLKPLILEAIEPTSCLSKEVNLIRGFLPFSETVSTFTSDGIWNTILCENPSANSSFWPWLEALYPTPTNSNSFIQPFDTPSIIL